MTPPKIDRVDIAPLDSLHLENFLDMEVTKVTEQLRGTDLYLDVKTGEFQRLLAGDQTEATSLEEEANWIQLIRSMDQNGDKAVDLEETRNLLDSSLPPEEGGKIHPEDFLASIDNLMTRRYGPLSHNMKSYRSETIFSVTLEAIKLYNDGVRLDELDLANRTFAGNGLGKTTVNIVGFLPSLARNLVTESPALVGDHLAEEAAEGRYVERKTAIDALETIVSQGILNHEQWALQGDLEAALALLEPEQRAILEQELCATELHRIIHLEDPMERYEALYDFAVAERPGFLGYGGGNTRGEAGFWNFSGRRNNVFFAKCILHFLIAKANSGDFQFDYEFKAKARAAYSDITGNPLAGYTNLFAVGFTNLLSAGGVIDEPTELHDWSDEASMDALGRGIDGVLLVLGTRRAFTFLGDAKRLTAATTAGQTVSVWWRNATFARPLGGDSLRAAAAAAEREAEMLGLTQAASKTKFGRWLDVALDPWRTMGRAMSARLFKGLPPLSPDQRQMLQKAGAAPFQGLDKMTRGVLIWLIVENGDNRISPPFNPVEFGGEWVNPEAEFERYPDPTQPDPLLQPSANRPFSPSF